MKPAIITGFIAILLICIAWWILDQASLQAQKSAVFGGLIFDVGKFYKENNRLPLNWREFDTWSGKSNAITHWHSDYLDQRFALKWGAHVSTNDFNKTKIFIAVDPRFKDIESSANDTLYRICSSISKANSTRHP